MKLGNFFIEDLFELKKGKITNASELEENNEIPYIGAKYKNNGVIKFCKRVEEKVTRGNCIVFICDGEGSMGLSFYKASDFLGTVNIVAGYNKNLTPNIGIYISTVANTVRGKYNFGYKRTLERLKRETLQLPIDKNGDPDWDFMENYIAEKSNQIKTTYQPPRPHDITDDRGLDEVEWSEFNINEIFTKIERGKRHKKSDHTLGNIPYISSTKLNNGCDGFIGKNSTVKVFKNCLTIANSGSVGSTFYHNYSFIASDHITALINPKFSKNHYLFIAGQLSKLSEKYSFNREINDKRIKREVIKLPSKIEGGKTLPDLDFMENYMKRLENKLVAEKLSAIKS